MQFGPAVKLNIETDKRNIQFWVFQHIQDIADVNPGLFSAVPLFNPGLFKPLVFSLRGIEGKYYTGLQVVRDPGVRLFWPADDSDRRHDGHLFHCVSAYLVSAGTGSGRRQNPRGRAVSL